MVAASLATSVGLRMDRLIHEQSRALVTLPPVAITGLLNSEIYHVKDQTALSTGLWPTAIS